MTEQLTRKYLAKAVEPGCVAIYDGTSGLPVATIQGKPDVCIAIGRIVNGEKERSDE